MAGFAHARRVFGGTPRGGGSQPYNHEGGPYGMSRGGAENDHGGTVPIVAAGGEYVVHPDHVREVGAGDLDMGQPNPGMDGSISESISPYSTGQGGLPATVQWIGTGACAAVGVATFNVTKGPLD